MSGGKGLVKGGRKCWKVEKLLSTDKYLSISTTAEEKKTPFSRTFELTYIST
jgi:hypothetical protein